MYQFSYPRWERKYEFCRKNTLISKELNYFKGCLNEASKMSFKKWYLFSQLESAKTAHTCGWWLVIAWELNIPPGNFKNSFALLNLLFRYLLFFWLAEWSALRMGLISTYQNQKKASKNISSKEDFREKKENSIQTSCLTLIISTLDLWKVQRDVTNVRIFFSTLNKTHSPFTVAQERCRGWEVDFTGIKILEKNWVNFLFACT